MSAYDIKQVVLCADDYALNAPVSQGIVALAVLGRLSATSVMSLSPRWAEDAVALRDVRERLDVGVHLDWTSPFATNDGHGSHRSMVALRAMLRLYKQEELVAEIERQLDAFEAQWQAPPDHIDGHQHIHGLPVFRDALADALLRHYGHLDVKPWLRTPPQGDEALQTWLHTHAWPNVGPLLGEYDFSGGESDYARHMQTWLALVPSDKVGLIMCNPGVSAQADDPLGATRQCEFAYLAGHDFVQHLVEAGVQIVRGSGRPIVQA